MLFSFWRFKHLLVQSKSFQHYNCVRKQTQFFCLKSENPDKKKFLESTLQFESKNKDLSLILTQGTLTDTLPHVSFWYTCRAIMNKIFCRFKWLKGSAIHHNNLVLASKKIGYCNLNSKINLPKCIQCNSRGR